MRMSVALDTLSGSNNTATLNSVHNQQQHQSGSSVSGEDELGTQNYTNTTNTPSPSPTPPPAPTSLTTSSGLSASTTTMVGQATQQSTITANSSIEGQQQFQDVVKTGNLRKVKGRKKFFVLRKESENGGIPARLEYYANERKFKLGQSPRKSIILKHCFNISRTDSKCKYAIALHTHNDCVRIAMNSEEEMNEWLRIMNSLAGDNDDEFLTTTNLDDPNGTTTMIPKPHFEHVWLVTALNKGLGSKENIIGPYRLCLTSKELTLLKVGDHDEKHSVGSLKFPLNVIRNVSHDVTFGCFFHIEFGRLASTGPGQLSLKTEDNNIAQNMHLLILKAMQNYSKDDIIPRDTRRSRTNTWNSSYNESSSFGSRHSSFAHHGHLNNQHGTTPPIMTRINSLDGSSMRIRTESIGSDSRLTGVSPPMPIIHNSMNPSLSFNSPLCSTTDSASSSYSIDYENNNNNHNHRFISGYQDEEEDESYVPWNPADDRSNQHPQTSASNNSLLTLQLQRGGTEENDYVETTIGSGGVTNSASKGSTAGSTSATPSSHMDTQSPVSPFDNYLPMSPGTPLGGEAIKTGGDKGRTSVPHSRTSSNIVDENEGYVPMIPGTYHGRSGSEVCSTAGSTTGGLDEAYFDMDLSRKLNISHDDFPRMSPASSESLQSSTPSSDFPLEKVSSYLLSTDDLDDVSGQRPARAYSVGSRSDTGSGAGKGRYGKNRLEAVQETFRMRALSVGAKMQKPNTTPNTTKTTPENSKRGDKSLDKNLPSVNAALTPLSNSWSGSTGKWPAHKFPSPAAIPIETTPLNSAKLHSRQEISDSIDSDLMELDFSHNKKNRKRSLPGPNLPIGSGSGLGPSSSIGSSVGSGQKLSPGLVKSGCETPDTPTESHKTQSFQHQQSANSLPCSKYPSSAPISIQKSRNDTVDSGDYMDTSGGGSILSRITGLDTKELKQLDKEGAYLDMNFGKPPATTSTSSKYSGLNNANNNKMSTNPNPVIVVKPNESVPPSVFTLNSTSTSTTFVSSSPKLAFFGVSASSMPAAPLSYFGASSSSPAPTNTTQSCTTLPPSSLNFLHPPAHSSTAAQVPTSTSPSLSRIEESPEKLESSRQLSQGDDDEDSKKITYAAIDHAALESLSPHKRPLSSVSPLKPDTACTSGKTSEVSSKVTYSQIDFNKSAEGVKHN